MASPTIRSGGWCALAAIAAACGGGDAEGGEWRVVDQAAASAAQRQQAEHGDAARAALGKTLLTELTAALGERGPAGAIEVCSVRGPALAVAVGQQHGVRIGRTATQLRNAGNRPPAWAKAAVAAGGAGAAGGKDPAAAWFAGPAGELGMLQPIVLQPMCVVCHGKPEQLGSGVADALRQRYPTDRATGFAPGDLRGWFWVEVPAGP